MDNQQDFLTLKETGKDTLDFIQKSTAPRLTNFSDEYLLTEYGKLSFPSGLSARTNFKNVLTRFYNFYFYGVISTEDNVVATIFDAIGISQIGSTVLFEDKFHADACYKSNTSNPEFSTSTVTVPGFTPTTPEGSESQAGANALANLYISTLNNNDVSSFVEFVKTTVSGIVSTAASSPNETALRSLTGFLALTLCRGAVKTDSQLTAAFHKKQYKANLQGVAGWKSEWGYIPPCAKCIQDSVNNFQIGLAQTAQIFTLVVGKFILTLRSTGGTLSGVQAYLAASLLTHTARNGLGLITLLDQACEITSYGWIDLAERCHYTVTKAGWKTIAEFYRDQLKKDAAQTGFNWARIINNGFFRGLSPKEHPFLATIFAAIVEKRQGPGIWGAAWAQDAAPVIAKQIGSEIYRQSQPDLDTLQGTTKAMEIALAVKRQLATHTSDGTDIDNAIAMGFDNVSS